MKTENQSEEVGIYLHDLVESPQMAQEESGLEEKLEATATRKGLFTQVTDIYFKPKSFEKSGKVYEWLGIKYFKKILMGTVGACLKKTGWGDYITPNPYFLGKKRDLFSLKFYGWGTKLAETVHMPFVIHGGKEVVEELADGNYGFAALSSVEFLLNAYPVMLQRYNRSRVNKIIDAKEQRTKHTK